MFTLAGKVVETLSGMKFTDFAKERILEPLGMGSATYNVERDAHDKLAQARLIGPNTKPLDLAPQFPKNGNVNQLGPCGGLAASSGDVLRWLQWRLTRHHAHVLPRTPFCLSPWQPRVHLLLHWLSA
jgi:CubicO group peptidase (beta-lactamase class C family)